VKIDLTIDGLDSRHKELERVSWAIRHECFIVHLEERIQWKVRMYQSTEVEADEDLFYQELFTFIKQKSYFHFE